MHDTGRLVDVLRARELFGHPVHSRPQVRDFQCSGPNSLCCGSILNDPQDTLTPAFAAQYSRIYNNSKYLAIGDEEGFVTILNTSAPLPGRTNDDEGLPTRPAAQWEAHKNAIFDVAWTRDDSIMLTASGDQTIGRFDTATAEPLGSFKGHGGSVKSVCAQPNSSGDVFASGARDGALMIWDSRLPSVAEINGAPYHRPVITINDAHAVTDGRKRSRRRMPSYGRHRPSVTSVLFLSCEHTLASGGVDGIVKLWDLRQAAAEPAPVVAVAPGLASPLPAAAAGGSSDGAFTLHHLADAPTPLLSQKQHGITCLSLHPSGAQLLVSLTGGHHLLYDAKQPDAGPCRWYGGHTVSSFYVKATFSPDGSHILSGSSDRSAYIWQVEGADGSSPYVLPGHEGEVTAVAWCPTDFEQITTTADDSTIRVWAVQRQQPEETANRLPSRLQLSAIGSSSPRFGAGRLIEDMSGPSGTAGLAAQPEASPGSAEAARGRAAAAVCMGTPALGLRSLPAASTGRGQQQQQRSEDRENADGNLAAQAGAGPRAQAQPAAATAPAASSRPPATPAEPITAMRSPTFTVNPLRQLQFTGRGAGGGGASGAATGGPRSRRTKQQSIAAFLRSPDPAAAAAACRQTGAAGASGCAADTCRSTGERQPPQQQQQASGSKRSGDDAALVGEAVPARRRMRISFERGQSKQEQQQQQQEATADDAPVTGGASVPAVAAAAALEPSPESQLCAKLAAASTANAAAGALTSTVPAGLTTAALVRQGSVDENVSGNGA